LALKVVIFALKMENFGPVVMFYLHIQNWVNNSLSCQFLGQESPFLEAKNMG
jgi:hypothetical protein